jgi:hypothetical protein
MDTRDWRQARRARTHRLIEYGGLVVKAGLPDLVGDDRATLLGAFIKLRAQLEGDGDVPPERLKLLWKRQGLAAFDADAEAKAAAVKVGDRMEDMPD